MNTELIYGNPATLLEESESDLRTWGDAKFNDDVQSKYGVSYTPEKAHMMRLLLVKGDIDETLYALQEIGELDSWTDRDTFSGVVNSLHETLRDGYCPRDGGTDVTDRSHREDITVAEVCERAGDEGTVYMAKSLTSAQRVRMAWDLHEDNQVVIVDDYDDFEEAFDWTKLTSLPRGRNKIRAELGDDLSDDLLDEIAPVKDGADGAGGPSYQRTQPQNKTLTISRDNSSRKRVKIDVDTIDDTFTNGNSLTHGIDELILFPPNVDANLSDNYWLGGRWPDRDTTVGLANCTKGVYEYLQDHTQVKSFETHYQEVLTQTYESNEGTVSPAMQSSDELLFHIWGTEDLNPVLEQHLSDFCDVLYSQSISVKDFDHVPEATDAIYVPITPSDLYYVGVFVAPYNDGTLCYDNYQTVYRSITNLNAINVISDQRVYAYAVLGEHKNTPEVSFVTDNLWRTSGVEEVMDIVKTLEHAATNDTLHSQQQP